MFSSTNELRGTSYKSRIDDPNISLQEKLELLKLSVLVKENENLILKLFKYLMRKEIMLYMLHLVHIEIQDMQLVSLLNMVAQVVQLQHQWLLNYLN